MILLHLEKLHKNAYRVQFLRESYSIHTIGIIVFEFMQILGLMIVLRNRENQVKSRSGTAEKQQGF